MGIRSLRDLLSRIPRKWKLRGLSFLVGLVVTLIWDIGTLLVIFFLIGVIAAILVNLGLAKVLNMERWALGQFWGRIRGMVIFAILPAAWEITKNFIKSPSTSSIIELLIILILIAVIWDRFQLIRKGYGRISTPSRRRRFR